MKMPYLVVFDTETTGLFADKQEVVQLAAVAYDPITLEQIPESDGGVFNSLLKPLKEENIQQKAMDVNKLKLEDLRKAPHPKAVWLDFLAYLKRFNPSGLVTSAPIAGGKNIRNFDFPFIRALNEAYGPRKGKDKKLPVVFNREQIDLEDQIRQWFWFDPELPNMSMDTLREFFGMSTDGAHSAIVDTMQCGQMITYFMKLTRQLRATQTVRGDSLLDFKKAFRGI